MSAGCRRYTPIPQRIHTTIDVCRTAQVGFALSTMLTQPLRAPGGALKAVSRRHHAELSTDNA